MTHLPPLVALRVHHLQFLFIITAITFISWTSSNSNRTFTPPLLDYSPRNHSFGSIIPNALPRPTVPQIVVRPGPPPAPNIPSLAYNKDIPSARFTCTRLLSQITLPDFAKLSTWTTQIILQGIVTKNMANRSGTNRSAAQHDRDRQKADQ